MTDVDAPLGWCLQHLVDEYGLQGVLAAIVKLWPIADCTGDDRCESAVHAVSCPNWSGDVPADRDPVGVVDDDDQGPRPTLRLIPDSDLLAATDHVARLWLGRRSVLILPTGHQPPRRIRVHCIGEGSEPCDWTDCHNWSTHEVEVDGAVHVSCDVHLVNMIGQ